MRETEKKHATFLDTMPEKILRFVKIRTRLVIAFITLSCLPMICVGILAITKSAAAMENNIGKFSEQLLRQININISNQLSELTKAMVGIASSKEVQDFTVAYGSMNSQSATEVFEKYDKLKTYINNEATANTIIEHVGLYCSDRSFSPLGTLLLNLDNHNSIFYDLERSEENLIWSFMDTSEYEDEPAINSPVLFMKVKSAFTAGTSFILHLMPNLEMLESAFANVDLGKGGELFILDENNKVIISNNRDHIGSDIGNILDISQKLTAANDESLDPHSFLHNTHNGKMLICHGFLPNGWRTVSVVPFNNLMKETDSIKSFISLIIIICSLLTVILSYMASRSVAAPVKRISNAVRRLKEGDFRIRWLSNTTMK